MASCRPPCLHYSGGSKAILRKSICCLPPTTSGLLLRTCTNATDVCPVPPAPQQPRRAALGPYRVSFNIVRHPDKKNPKRDPILERSTQLHKIFVLQARNLVLTRSRCRTTETSIAPEEDLRGTRQRSLKPQTKSKTSNRTPTNPCKEPFPWSFNDPLA